MSRQDVGPGLPAGWVGDGLDAPEMFTPDERAAMVEHLRRDRALAQIGSLYDDEENAGPRALLQNETITQVADALAYMGQDFSRSPRVPWDALFDVVGWFLPFQFWVVAAATGNGKSTTLMSIVLSLLEHRQPVYMYPLEQRTDVMRLYLAAIACGYHPALVQENNWANLPADARTRLAAHLDWQVREAEGLLHFAPESTVTAAVLERGLKEAKAFGAKLVIIDHIHRLSLDSRNAYESLREMCVLLKELAKSYNIPILCAAQLHRDKEHDVLAPYKPPKPTAIQGGEVIRQECDVALGLYRPLIEMFGKSDALAVRMGQKRIKDFLKPNALGVHVLKHRLRGDALGDVIELEYRNGRILDPATETREAWESRNGL